MAWNSSNAKLGGSPSAGYSVASHRGSSNNGRRISKGVYTVLILLAVVAVGVFLFLPKDTLPAPEKPAKRHKQARMINTKPKPAPLRQQPVEEPAPKPVDPNARPTKVGEIVNNYIKLPSGRLHYIKGEVTNNVAATMPKEWYEVFNHQCENEIALYLTMEPGETLVGTPVYRGRFLKDFLKSLETPIIANSDDPQEVKDLKRIVTEAKIELKAAYDRGEDIEQIMLDTRSQLQDLAAYKQALESDVKEVLKQSSMSPKDLDEFIEAANKMLAEKGIAPMTLNPLARKRLERLIQQKANEHE